MSSSRVWRLFKKQILLLRVVRRVVLVGVLMMRIKRRRRRKRQLWMGLLLWLQFRRQAGTVARLVGVECLHTRIQCERRCNTSLRTVDDQMSREREREREIVFSGLQPTLECRALAFRSGASGASRRQSKKTGERENATFCNTRDAIERTFQPGKLLYDFHSTASWLRSVER